MTIAPFETILRRYELDDPALWAVTRIARDADLADDRFDAPEAPELGVICRGLSMNLPDETVLDVVGHVFDGLYEYPRRGLLLGRDSS